MQLACPTILPWRTTGIPSRGRFWANEGVDKQEIWSFYVKMGKVVADVYDTNEDGSKGTLCGQSGLMPWIRKGQVRSPTACKILDMHHGGR